MSVAAEQIERSPEVNTESGPGRVIEPSDYAGMIAALIDEGYSYRDMAKALGVNVSAVHKRYHRKAGERG